MKKFILFFCTIWIISNSIAQHNIVIQSGATISTSNNAVIVFNDCNLDNASNNVSFSNSLLTENGNINTNIGGTGMLDFKQITINKPGATLKMVGDLTIQDKLIFQTGFVDLNNHILNLAPLALLKNEKSTGRLIGDNGGFASINVLMNNPNLQNPGNLGLSVTSSADMGTVSILRGHKIQTQGGSPFSIKRNYAIESSNGENFNGLLRFAYFDDELAGIDESVLQIWSSIDAANWINEGYTAKDETQNYLESSNINSLSWFTMSNPTPGIKSDPVFDYRVNKDLNKTKQILFDAKAIPNPCIQNEPAWIELTASHEVKGIIQLINPMGEIVNTKPFQTKIGYEKFLLSTQDLIKGMYFVKVTLNTGNVKNLKLQIQ